MTTDFDSYVNAQDAQAEREILGLIASVAHINDELKPLEVAKKYAVERIKNHMQLNDMKIGRAHV